MAIAHAATEYVFSNFLLKDPTQSKYKGVRGSSRLVSLCYLFPSRTQISCFVSTNFSRRQAAYVDSFCWAAVQEQQPSVVGFFPYILLLLAILMYIPTLFWRFMALDRSYKRAIRLAKSLASFIDTKDVSDDPPSTCRVFTLLTLLLACLYLRYYIRLASFTDENSSAVAVQCKLVAVGVFRQSSRFLRPYEMLPAFDALDLDTPFYNDLSMYLLFLEDNLSEFKSCKCLQVLELLREGGGEAFDTMCLLQTLGQAKTCGGREKIHFIPGQQRLHPGIKPGSVMTPQALLCIALDRCATREAHLKSI
uniref:Pannexin 1b n=1 Tax=Salmo trutta TaxID=8032 RepID=A0A673YSY9_SALTR